MKALEVRNISKMFPGNLANDNISFSVEKGEIFAIVGRKRSGQEHTDEHHLRHLHGLRRRPPGQ